MDSSVAARALLISKADGFFWGLIGSTIILFVGAIMEYVHPLNRLPTHNVNTRTHARTPRNWVIRSQSAWHNIAIVFVVVGIGGEGVFEYLGARAESAVRNFDNRIAVQAETDAGNAEISAKNAAAAAIVAKGKADDVGKEADAAQLKIAGVQGRAGEIDKQLTWVKLTQSSRYVEDEDGLKNDLRKDFKGSHIAFRSYIGDSEASLACDQLIQIAINAEVEPKDECGMEPLSRHPIIDLVIKGPDPDEVMRLTETLKKSGRISGIQVNTGKAPSLTVFVAARRSWFLGWTKKTPNTKTSATKPAK